MTLDLMTEQVKAELAALSPKAKLELMALIRNRAAVIVGNAELFAGIAPSSGPITARFAIIKATALQMVDEISALLKEKE